MGKSRRHPPRSLTPLPRRYALAVQVLRRARPERLTAALEIACTIVRRDGGLDPAVARSDAEAGRRSRASWWWWNAVVTGELHTRDTTPRKA